MSTMNGHGFKTFTACTLDCAADAAAAGPDQSPPAKPKGPEHPHSRLRNLHMDRPWGRVIAGRIEHLTPAARHQGELLVTALWVAHRAARRLRRQLILQRKATRGERSVNYCPDCGDDKGSDLCPFSAAMDVLTNLVRPQQNGYSDWELGRSADELAWLLPWFDVRTTIDNVEGYFAQWHQAEAVAEADPPPPSKG